MSLSPSLSLLAAALYFLSPRAWPNPEAQHHCSISVTFDGPGLKQIYIPLVDFKRCLNNDASQRRGNEACSGLATSDFKINLIRGRDIICAPLFAPSLSLCPSLFHLDTLLLASFPPFGFLFKSPNLLLSFPTLSLSSLRLPSE